MMFPWKLPLYLYNMLCIKFTISARDNVMMSIFPLLRLILYNLIFWIGFVHHLKYTQSLLKNRRFSILIYFQIHTSLSLLKAVRFCSKLCFQGNSNLFGESFFFYYHKKRKKLSLMWVYNLVVRTLQFFSFLTLLFSSHFNVFLFHLLFFVCVICR